MAAVDSSRREGAVQTRLFPIVGLALVLSACVTSGAREDELTTTVRAYENTIRWGTIPAAYDFLRPDIAAAAELPKGLDEIKVTGYDRLTGLVPTDDERQRFRTSASIRYVHVDRQVERGITDPQVWEWDAEAKRWWRANPIPAFP
jgi:hypothetical protein